MGQAFDRDGNVLGEAFGETKDEVLKKLMAAHGEDAAEIRIKMLETAKAQEEAVAKARDEAPQRDRMMQFFVYAHLPAHLATISAPFGQLAEQIVATLPSNPERTVALRKLLEAKDCAVRALLFK
jgi:hypothetical protein